MLYEFAWFSGDRFPSAAAVDRKIKINEWTGEDVSDSFLSNPHENCYLFSKFLPCGLCDNKPFIATVYDCKVMFTVVFVSQVPHLTSGRFCFPSVKCRRQCLWMTPREAVRCDELLAELCLPVHQNSMILNYPISLARTALISPAWRANMSLTTKTRCGLPSEGAQDFYKHLTWL